ncbi:MAG: TonB-dependent receptor [Leptospirales bacterium]|nr:TonB-dependent receptor [Leptospirales bacterium]
MQKQAHLSSLHAALRRLTAALVLLAPGALLALEARLRVIDPSNQQPVADAQAIILETRQRYFTDNRGEATISVPAPGRYTVRVILPDGKLLQASLEIRSANQLLSVYSSQPPAAGRQTADSQQEIVIHGSRDRTQLSRYQVRLDEVRRIPGQFGEALRGIESLPGVSAAPYGNGEISLRGADEGSNTYLVDELPIGYAFHFFPVNSVLHNDFLKSIDIYNGSYPAAFGNATGGVISMHTVDGPRRFGGHSSFSLWAANALFQAPFDFGPSDAAAAQTGPAAQTAAAGSEDQRTTEAAPESDSGVSGYWIGAGRISYLHLTFSSLVPNGVNLPIYWDGQFKSMVRFSPEHSLYFYALGARDTYSLDSKDNGPQLDPTKEIDPIFIGANVAFERAYHTEALRHVWQPGARLQNRITALYTNSSYFIQGQLGILRADQEVQQGYVGLREELFWDPIPDHLGLEAGGEIRSFFYRNNGITVRQRTVDDGSVSFFRTTNPDFEVVTVRDSQKTELNSGWAQLSLAGYGFEFKPGVRADSFGLSGQTVSDPRGTISYRFPTRTLLIAGGGVYHRAPEPNEYSPTSGNPNLHLERAEHYSGGIQQEWDRYLFKIEGFRHYFRDLVVVDPYIRTLARQNQDPYTRYDRPILFNDPLGFSNDGRGWSEGVELYIKRNKEEDEVGWYGWISYTYSRSFRNDHQLRPELLDGNFSADQIYLLSQVYDNAEEHLADFDRTHIVNVIFGYKFSAEWQLGFKWRYSSGEPYTLIIGDDGGLTQNRGRTIYEPVYSRYRNSERLPEYQRLDFRVDRFFNYGWGYGNVFFEMLNVYVRKNVIGKAWDRRRPYSASNPEPTYDFLLLQQDSGDRRILIPFFNIGVEVKF